MIQYLKFFLRFRNFNKITLIFSHFCDEANGFQTQFVIEIPWLHYADYNHLSSLFYHDVLCLDVSNIPLLKKGSKSHNICLLRYKFLDGCKGQSGVLIKMVMAFFK